MFIACARVKLFIRFIVILQTNTCIQNTMGSIRTVILHCRQLVLDISAELDDSTPDRHMGFDWYVL